MFHSLLHLMRHQNDQPPPVVRSNCCRDQEDCCTADVELPPATRLLTARPHDLSGEIVDTRHDQNCTNINVICESQTILHDQSVVRIVGKKSHAIGRSTETANSLYNVLRQICPNLRTARKETLKADLIRVWQSLQPFSCYTYMSTLILRFIIFRCNSSVQFNSVQSGCVARCEDDVVLRRCAMKCARYIVIWWFGFQFQ